MSQIEKSLNKLLCISEALSSIPSFADYIWENNKRVYNTKLAQESFQISSGIISISKSRREKVLSKWSLFLENKITASELSRKDFEILTFETDVILHSQFWDILMDMEEVSSKIIIGLVYSVHKVWSSIENLESVLHVIRIFIYNFKGRNKLVDLWKKNFKYILSIESPILLAKDFLNTNAPIVNISNKYYINLEKTEFGQLVHKKILEEKILRHINNRSFSLSEVQSLITEISTVSFYKKESNFYYALIILGVDVSQKDKNEMKDFLKDYFINHIDYKDPRKNIEKWLSFDENAKNIFISWLNEQDIRVFFDVFINYDPHGRKQFWLNYSRQVKNTQILQCSNLSQNIRNKDKISELIKKGYVFSELVNAQSNAFILDFQDFTIIEFSESGNACYIYLKNNLPIKKDKKVYYAAELRDKTKAVNVVIHNKNWQYNLTNWLAYRGIRP